MTSLMIVKPVDIGLESPKVAICSDKRDNLVAQWLISDAEVIRLLSYAKIKLLTEGIPLQLKAVSYLRLCCTAMRKLHQTFKPIEPNNSNEPTEDSSFSNLLADLCHHNPEWWKQCWISDHGVLRSNDAAISKLLQPLGYFIMFGNDASATVEMSAIKFSL